MTIINYIPPIPIICDIEKVKELIVESIKNDFEITRIYGITDENECHFLNSVTMKINTYGVDFKKEFLTDYFKMR